MCSCLYQLEYHKPVGLCFNLAQAPPPALVHSNIRLTRANRLEAATSRLEDMAMSLDDPNDPKSTGTPTAASPAVPEPPKPAPPPPAAPAAAPIPPQIQDFDALINGDVQNFVNLGQKIGGLVAEQACFADCDNRKLVADCSIEQSSSAGLSGRAYLPLCLDKGQEARASARGAYDRPAQSFG